VGLACVQLAKAHGMTVIGTAGSEAGIDLLKNQGADFVFNHRENNYMEKIKKTFTDGVDIVLEMLANVNLNNDLQILKYKKGRVVVV
jgi:NADPH:quinone reductase